MDKLIALLERHLGGSWRDVVEYLRDQNALEDVERRLEAGDADGAIQGVEDAAAKFATDLHAGYTEAGQQAAEWLGDQVDGAIVRFDGVNERAVAWAQANQLETVRAITTEQRDLIRRVIADGVRDGRNPREMARDLRDSIGLTDTQAQYVQNYRNALESQDWANALSRELTDGRSDRSVVAAQRAGRPLTSDQIDTMVERYRRNMVNMRAETIARTEALRVAHQGTEELFRQAIDNGDVEADDLVREWHHASVGRHPRWQHAEMNGQTRPFGEPFKSGTGVELRYPGDPSAGAGETANCRCVVSTGIAA